MKMYFLMRKYTHNRKFTCLESTYSTYNFKFYDYYYPPQGKQSSDL